jgi:hypothetical protein
LLDAFYVQCLRAFVAFRQLELHNLTLFKGFVPLAKDGRVVDKHIAPGIMGNETVALPVIEPFNLAAGHKIQLVASGNYLLIRR